MGQGARKHGLLWLAIMVSWSVLSLQPFWTSHAQPNGTLQSDYDALVMLLANISPLDGTVLALWDMADPCLGKWPGVFCSCSDLPRIVKGGCNSSDDASGYLRVRALDLGPVTTGIGSRLQGNISASLGSLTALTYLDLSANAFGGTLPATLAQLSNLQWMLLDNNQLTGSLPAFLGQMPSLKRVLLQNNRFAGPVPSSWCAGNATFDVSNNQKLCGSLPKCMNETTVVTGMEGTYLSQVALSPYSQTGGVCDDSAPDCDPDVGCVVWTPKYWTSESIVAFNFTGFMDYQSGISHTQWGVGSKPFAADVVALQDVAVSRVLKDVKYSGGTKKKMWVVPMVHNLTSLSLLEGPAYYVTVVAFNGAGPPLSTSTTSAAVYVDTSGPTPAAVYNTYNYQQAASTKLTTWLQASWDNFTDAQSGVQGYTVEFIQLVPTGNNGTMEKVSMTDPLPAGQVTKVQLRVSQPLQDGIMYLAQVTATNGAGLSTTVQGLPIVVKQGIIGGVSPGDTALVVILSGLGCLAMGAGLSVLIMRASVRKQQKREKERAQEAKQLKALMYALVSHSDVRPAVGGSVTVASAKKVDQLDKEAAFVVTDIESSTELSNQDPEAFKQLQEVHDQLMREAIAKHSGYEIITEGDSFQVAFSTCQQALSFCLEAQYRLLEQTWSKEVLRLNACKAIRGADGELLMAGPRVRMGVHWAREGTMAARQHNLTRHRVYAGPAVQIAGDVGEAANGGQILLTEEAILKLSENMSMAGFPVIRLEGLYQLQAIPSPVYLFSCTEVVGRPLRRTFEGLRKVKKIWPQPKIMERLPATLMYNIVLPPLPNASNCLAFACLRLTTLPKDKDKARRCLPKGLQEKLEEVFAIQAQQFRGYLFQTHENAFNEGIWTVAFQSSVDALRFTHAAQMLLMHTQWPSWAQPYCGQSVPGPDGRWLFHGPRVVMTVHESPDFFVSEEDSLDPSAPRKMMCFAGPGVTLPLVLTYAGRGGQIILSEGAWDSVKPVVTQHPGAVTVISLGTHKVSDDFPVPMLLMEVMPNLLAKRVFHSVMTKKLIEPGYREAPDPREPMTIMFVKVSKPVEVVEAEKGTCTDDDIKILIQEYQMSVSMYTSTARRLLRKYNGYECKEPEPGKFTLAFQDLQDAIGWSCHLQEDLLYLKWPSRLLAMQECREQRDSHGQLIWCGLRVKIGMAHGLVSSKKPLNSGRADYFGVLANGAARVMGLADTGQVLIEAASPPLHEGRLLLQPTHETELRMLNVPGPSNKARQLQEVIQKAAADDVEGMTQDARTIKIWAVGYFLLRGLDNPRLIYEARGVRLQHRNVQHTSDMLMPACGHQSGASVNSSFASSRDSLRRNWSSWVERRGWFSAAGRLTPSPVLNGPSNKLPSPSAAGHGRQGMISADGAVKKQDLSSALAAGGSCTAGRTAGSQDVQARAAASARSAAAAAKYAYHEGGSELAAAGEGASPRQHMALLEAGSAPVRTRSELVGRQAELAAAVDSASAVKNRETPGSSQRTASVPNLRTVMTDPLLGQYSIPPIQTAIAPAVAADFTDGSSRHAPSTSAGYGDSSNEPSPVTAEAAGSSCQSQQPQAMVHQQQQQWQHLPPQGLRSMHSRSSGSGQSSGRYSSAAIAAAASHALPRDHRTEYRQELLSQQQQAQQHMQQLVSGRQSRQLSLGSDSDSGAAGLLSGMVGAIAGATEHQRGSLQAILFRPAQALISRVRRRSSHSSRHSKSAGGANIMGSNMHGENDDDDDVLLEAIRSERVRLGLMASINTSSMPQTPASTGSPSSVAFGTLTTHANLASPGVAMFARDIAQSFVNQRHNSITSAQQGFSMPYPGLGEVGSPPASGSPPLGGSPLGPGFSYAPSSYSPQHFQQVLKLGCWQQQQQQQPVAQLLEAQPVLQQNLLMSLAESAALADGNAAAAACDPPSSSHVERNAEESAVEFQHIALGDLQLQQQLATHSQQQQQQHQSQSAQHPAGVTGSSGAGGSSAAVMSWLAQRPEAAGMAVQAAAVPGSPFSLQTAANLRGIMLLNEQEQAAVRAAGDGLLVLQPLGTHIQAGHGESLGVLPGAASSSNLLQQHDTQHTRKTGNSRCCVADQVQQIRARGGVVYTASEWAERRQQQEEERAAQLLSYMENDDTPEQLPQQEQQQQQQQLMEMPSITTLPLWDGSQHAASGGRPAGIASQPALLSSAPSSAASSPRCFPQQYLCHGDKQQLLDGQASQLLFQQLSQQQQPPHWQQQQQQQLTFQTFQGGLQAAAWQPGDGWNMSNSPNKLSPLGNQPNNVSEAAACCPALVTLPATNKSIVSHDHVRGSSAECTAFESLLLQQQQQQQQQLPREQRQQIRQLDSRATGGKAAAAQAGAAAAAAATGACAAAGGGSASRGSSRTSSPRSPRTDRSISNSQVCWSHFSCSSQNSPHSAGGTPRSALSRTTCSQAGSFLGAAGGGSSSSMGCPADIRSSPQLVMSNLALATGGLSPRDGAPGTSTGGPLARGWPAAAHAATAAAVPPLPLPPPPPPSPFPLAAASRGCSSPISVSPRGMAVDPALSGMLQQQDIGMRPASQGSGMSMSIGTALSSTRPERYGASATASQVHVPESFGSEEDEDKACNGVYLGPAGSLGTAAAQPGTSSAPGTSMGLAPPDWYNAGHAGVLRALTPGSVHSRPLGNIPELVGLEGRCSDPADEAPK